MQHLTQLIVGDTRPNCEKNWNTHLAQPLSDELWMKIWSSIGTPLSDHEEVHSRIGARALARAHAPPRPRAGRPRARAAAARRHGDSPWRMRAAGAVQV